MAQTSARSELISKFQLHKKDVGSPEVQIALLTQRIARLTEHMSQHKHDNATRRGLIQIVNRRRRLMSYLGRESSARLRKHSDAMGLSERAAGA